MRSHDSGWQSARITFNADPGGKANQGQVKQQCLELSVFAARLLQSL